MQVFDCLFPYPVPGSAGYWDRCHVAAASVEQGRAQCLATWPQIQQIKHHETYTWGSEA